MNLHQVFSPMKLFDYQIHCNMRFSIPTYLSDFHDYQHKTRMHTKISIASLATDVSDFISKFAGDRTYSGYQNYPTSSHTFFSRSISYKAKATELEFASACSLRCLVYVC